MLVIWQLPTIAKQSFNMYNANNHLDGYCLSYHWHRESLACDRFCHNLYSVQMMSYCLRPAENNYSPIISNFQYTTNGNITFAQLREKNITSEMLLYSSTHIDMAERYQIFLNNYSNLSSENEVVFHNCITPWFGPFCQFTFDYQSTGLFEDIVRDFFHSKYMVHGDPAVTCYIHLACQTLLSCLDWREICDGKQDCLDGADEKNCWQLEMNQCNDNEYRCSNGQCIPWEYYRDSFEQSECLDQTDELPFLNTICYQSPWFQCEEHTCRPGKAEFPCGDGECISEMSRCQNGRQSFLPRNFCTNVTLCLLGFYNEVDDEWCVQFCSENDCLKDNCSIAYEFRYLPLLFGHVRYIVSNQAIESDEIHLPDYICYDTRLCEHLPPPTASFDHLTCHRFEDLKLKYADYSSMEELAKKIKNLFRRCLTTVNTIYNCNSSTMYQCISSTKCISKHRLLDGIDDCPFGDDETYNQSCSLSDIHQRFKCKAESREKCFTLLAIQNGRKECYYGEDEYERDEVFAKTHISFPTICDGITNLLPLLIDGQNETDETGCEHWQCNNTYSQCDGIWLCKNGADEVDCPFTTCPTHHHSCVFSNDSSKVSCLPIDQAGNDADDCVGGTDERKKNRLVSLIPDYDIIEYRFRCRNDTKLIFNVQLCDHRSDCPLNDDESFCKNFATFPDALCDISEDLQTDVENFLCNVGYALLRKSIILFRLHNVMSYPLQLEMNNALNVSSTPMKSLTMTAEDLNDNRLSYSAWTCNRGIPINSLTHENVSRLLCLCPPSYYGDRCQYQNQRVSLTLQIRLTSDWRNTFVFLITLTDTETNIESYEYIQHIPSRYCPIKYNIYLLYTNRPKNSSKSFFVRIDAFTQMTLKYRGSWIFPLQFSFLPVHRLAVLLRVPFSTTILTHQKCSPPCIHGRCFFYVNDQKSTFCHCESGWSGVQCHIKHACKCASDATCIDDSICLCPPGQWGSRCHLSHSICHSQLCMNGGQCVPIDTRYVSSNAMSTICICPEGYTGEHCQYQQNQTEIDISFHHKLTIPSFLLVHFIAARYDQGLEPNRTSIAKKLQFDQQSITLYTTTFFNIAIAQMLTHYYLIVLHEETIATAHISTEVIPDHRCRSLVELFNHTFQNQNLLKRIKSYHLPCQQHRNLVCFYDDVHICLCTLDRSANCLEFDHNMTYECEKSKYCGNGGECFQDDLICPTASFCACHLCYFGSRCQFSTKGSTLSLDIILAYHIRSKNKISEQPAIVKTAIALVPTILVLGILNTFFSFQTFRGKETSTVGCSLYLSTASIVSIIIVIVVTLKFALLMASQVGSIDNRWFLHIQCVSIDFLLRFLLSTSDWLSACVAIERVVNVTQGVKFNKNKSKRVAKWVILIVLLFTSCSYIYDPVHRRVMDDEEEQRTWCVTQYSSSVQVIDWMMNIFHFSLPFAINAVSALTIIITVSRTRSSAQKAKPFKVHLYEQLQQHKHLLISPLILVVLALPRLVISFLSGCMGSARESWFYFVGYYVSFIPAIMTLVVFILPSDLYKKEFYEVMKRTWHFS